MSARETLSPYLLAELITPLQMVFVETLERIVKERLPDAARVAIAFASAAPAHGHVAARLDALPSLIRFEAEAEVLHRIANLDWPNPEEMRAHLSKSALVREPNDDKPTPLVLDGMRLYLDRYFLDERAVLEAITRRLEPGEPLGDDEAVALRLMLERLFRGSNRQSFEQKQAAATALLRKATIVTGGPGTGKTTTVVRLLAALQERSQGALRIQLMAPTGKAAQRMGESIRGQLRDIDSPYRDEIPVEARTIHRGLGVIPNRAGRFRHSRDNPLPADVVVVDEASMIDLPLMARLLEALPPAAHLILLGDRDQLASVHAGAVLGDLCGEEGRDRRLSRSFAAELSKLVDLREDAIGNDKESSIADAVVELRHSHRFDEHSGIGRLARAVNEGDADSVTVALEKSENIEHIRLAKGDALPERLKKSIVDGFKAAISKGEPKKVLEELNRIRVLCAHRKGARGVEGLNRLIVEWLAKEEIIDPRGAYFHGRLLMITENDYRTRLFNGDIGIVLREKNTGTLKAYFDDERDGEPRSLLPTQLPAHETAFAMTIHKSQGSEFDEVVVMLPDERSPILTRELIYTGITRAKSGVKLVGSDEVIKAAIKERIERQSGLEEWLWK